MSKAVNIIEVLEKAQQSPASVSKRNKQAIVDAYGRALTMQKVLADFIKVNRQLMIDLSMSENANLLHGKGLLTSCITKTWCEDRLAVGQGETWRDCVSSMQSANAV
jgi:hypothetical protein